MSFSLEKKSFSNIPVIALLLLLLCVVVWWQYIEGNIAYQCEPIFYTLGLLAACLAIIHAQVLYLGNPERYVLYLACSLAFVSFFNAVLFCWRFFSFVFLNSAYQYGDLWGSIGQVNVFNVLMFLGVFSFFYIKNYYKNIYYFIPAFFIFVALGFVSSRALWLYSLIFLVCGFAKRKKEFIGDALLFFIGVFVIFFSPKLFAYFSSGQTLLSVTSDGPESLSRIYSLKSEIRFDLWREALSVFFEHPYAGAGLGSAGYQHFLYIVAHPEVKYPEELALENYHNTLLHGMAELGGGFLVVWVVVNFLIIKAIIKLRCDFDIYFSASIFVVFSYSLLEYPFSFSYFLIIFMAFVGGLSTPVFVLKGQLLRMGTLIVLFFFSCALPSVLTAYLSLADLYGGVSRNIVVLDQKFSEKIELAGHGGWFENWLDRLIVGIDIDAFGEHAYPGLLNISDRAIRFRTTPTVVKFRICVLRKNALQIDADRLEEVYKKAYPITLLKSSDK